MVLSQQIFKLLLILDRTSISFSLKVKFFASDPHNLHDEYTRYLVVLQLREDIHKGKLVCNDLQLAAELAALLLQGLLLFYI